MSDFSESVLVTNEMACKKCGAMVKFKPGSKNLICEYCHAENEIVQASPATIVEIDLEEFLAAHHEEKEKIEVTSVKCQACGATSTVDPKVASDKCPFCATTFVLKDGSSSTLYKPQYVLPFGIDEQKALENFRSWLKGLWFAPSELCNYTDRADRLSGMYLPFWTFDCHTDSMYTGQRGVDYTVSESYTDGKGVTQTRMVTRTNWYSVSGSVSNDFDDILIEASNSLPKDKLRALEPWDLKNVMEYNDQFLQGFRTENYQVDLPTAFVESKKRMVPVINQTINHNIGGDRQTINSVSTTYTKSTFKYILLPVWISAYRYNNKVYQFLVNARTGEVQGNRPWSVVKIALAVIAGVIVLGVLLYVWGRSR
jgi:hypothetical protein